jgi:hypothetical protein
MILIILCDLGMFLANPPVLFYDNYLVSNPILHASKKHIEVDYHFVLEHATWEALHVQFNGLIIRL